MKNKLIHDATLFYLCTLDKSNNNFDCYHMLGEQQFAIIHKTVEIGRQSAKAQLFCRENIKEWINSHNPFSSF